MEFSFPKIYPILDASVLPSVALGRAEFLEKLGNGLVAAGVTLLEYRNKTGGIEELRADAAILRRACPKGQVKLILDDRADLVDKLDFDGVHVDGGDMNPTEARWLLGPDSIIGTFGGGEMILPGILSEPVDYLSIGPVFQTQTKQTTKAPIGADGVRKLCQEIGASTILVGVGGITLETASAILAAGANTVAVSAAIFRATDPIAEFRRWMTELG